MSDTPRTEAWRDSDNGESAVAYDHCAELECELTAALAERDEWRKRCGTLENELRAAYERT